jgi:hypothetical protein
MQQNTGDCVMTAASFHGGYFKPLQTNVSPNISSSFRPPPRHLMETSIEQRLAEQMVIQKKPQNDW